MNTTFGNMSSNLTDNVNCSVLQLVTGNNEELMVNNDNIVSNVATIHRTSSRPKKKFQ
jgi:hypothetical protein